jgi:hypothetical protein
MLPCTFGKCPAPPLRFSLSGTPSKCATRAGPDADCTPTVLQADEIAHHLQDQRQGRIDLCLVVALPHSTEHCVHEIAVPWLRQVEHYQGHPVAKLGMQSHSDESDDRVRLEEEVPADGALVCLVADGKVVDRCWDEQLYRVQSLRPTYQAKRNVETTFIAHFRGWAEVTLLAFVIAAVDIVVVDHCRSRRRTK